MCHEAFDERRRLCSCLLYHFSLSIAKICSTDMLLQRLWENTETNGRPRSFPLDFYLPVVCFRADVHHTLYFYQEPIPKDRWHYFEVTTDRGTSRERPCIRKHCPLAISYSHRMNRSLLCIHTRKDGQ